MKRNDIAAVVPVFNPEDGLIPLCETLLTAFEMVVVVDDGSIERQEDFKRLPKGVHLLQHAVNRGKGCAIKTALAWLKECAPQVKTAVFADGDGQHRAEDVARVAERSVETGRVALGVRDFTRAGIPFRSRFGNVLTSFLVRMIYHIPIHDTQTGLRAIPSRLFDLMLETPGERYEYEMRLFGRLSDAHEPVEQVSIETIYIANNRASHFHPVRDSLRVYRGLFAGSFFRFVLSSLAGFVVDNITFSILLLTFTGLGLVQHSGIFLALVLARILSAFVNYLLNRLFVFGSTVRQSASLGRYAALAVSLVVLSYLGTLALTAVFDVHGLAVTAVKIVVEVFLFLLSYRAQQIWVFQANPETEFDAVDACKRMLTVCGPFVPFLLLLVVDVSVLLCGQGWNFSWCTFGYALKCSLVTLLPIMSLPLVFRGLTRLVLPILFVWMLIVDVLELVVYNKFHMTVRGELVAIVMGSSWRETVAFLSGFLTFGNALLVLLLVVAVWFGCRWLWRNPASYPRHPVLSYFMALVLVGLGVRLGYTARNVLAFDIVVDAVEQFSRYRNLARAVANPDLSDVIAPDRHVPLVVFTIGESATRDHWQLYGYPLETTPKISGCKDELVVFDDLLAPWSHTQEVIQLMLTRGTLDDRDNVVATMPQILTKAGYRCILLSNQAHWGIYDSIDSLLFTGCDERIYLDDIRPKIEGEDERLIAYVTRELSRYDRREDPRPLVLFVHLYGSHWPYRFRFPASAAHFSAPGRIDPKHAGLDDSVEAYDDSIRHTDSILGAVLESLRARDEEIVMIHLSDHGDTPDVGKPRVMNEPSLWRVPFFIWCSPAYRARYPERMAALERVKGLPHQSDRLYDGFLELMNVRLKDREAESFLSEAYDRSRPRRVEDGRREVGPKW